MNRHPTLPCRGKVGWGKPEVILVEVMNQFSVYDLEQRIKERAAANAEVSYTRKLLDRGVAQCAKKLGEEAVELALASVGEGRERLMEEAADLIYHLLVVLKARDITLAEVEAVLGARANQSGLAEKASRKGG
jgi:phosphoribosyl-ATP pyrophosphohydrolase